MPTGYSQSIGLSIISGVITDVNNCSSEIEIRKCLNCGNELIGKNKIKFCCQSCSAKYNNKTKQIKPQEKECELCHNKFITKNKEKRFCSKKCSIRFVANLPRKFIPFCCKFCGETNKNNFYGKQRQVCKHCRNIQSQVRLRNYKIQLVEYKGGKCCKCGYNKSIAALALHHRNPEEKDVDYYSMRNWSFEKRKTEADKCDLLCANCHAELHEIMTIERAKQLSDKFLDFIDYH